jgi:hypothetical protein
MPALAGGDRQAGEIHTSTYAATPVNCPAQPERSWRRNRTTKGLTGWPRAGRLIAANLPDK